MELPRPVAEKARALAEEIEAIAGPPERTGHSPGFLLSCSFCGKSQRQVRTLIPGPTVNVCDECIRLCNEIIEEEMAGEEKRLGAHDVHLKTLAAIARQFAEASDKAVELPRPVAERARSLAEGARALAEEIEAIASEKS